jgi:hypothetical protein
MGGQVIPPKITDWLLAVLGGRVGNSLPETLKRRIKRYDKLPLFMGTSNDSP